MKNKWRLGLVLVAVVTVFGCIGTSPAGIDSVPGVTVASRPIDRLPVTGPKEGPGPQCIPGVGCGYL